jgi:diguanylate cyclase (GGDEF)-like protein/PAS domain S-box-containing protein
MNIVTLQFWLIVQYIPHGDYYLWQTPWIWLHVLADTLIAIAYYSIPVLLIYFIYQKKSLPFNNIFILFSAAIITCGTTHVLNILTWWYPNYWLSGIIKAITALISLATALSLIPLITKILNLSSPEQLCDLNYHYQLLNTIPEQEPSQNKIQLLNRNSKFLREDETTALVKANLELQASINFSQKITDSTPNILYIYDLAKKRNIYCNSFINELLGYSISELQRLQTNLLEELIHPEDVEKLKTHLQNCLELKDEQYLEIEYRIKNSKGNWHWLHDKNIVFTRNLENKPHQILGIAQDITKNKEIQSQAVKLNQKLEEKILVLEQTNQARIQLAELNEYIQACTSIDEAKEILANLLPPLFPNSHGAVYLVNNNNNLLDAIAAWGIPNSDSSFETKECWALRRGNAHLTHPTKAGLYCNHIGLETKLTPTLCLPMIAKGETLGMLYLRFDNSEAINKTIQELAETVGQNIAMSFANLKLQEKLRYQSLRDPLTGLFNRRYLQESLAKELERAQRQKNKQFVSLIMLDIDHFKRFNDIYGHSAGDLVLREVGAFIQSQIRQYDIACRYGGEELVIVMPDASLETTIIRAEEIRTGVKKIQLEHEGQKLCSISVSIGVSCFPDNSVDFDGLIRAADKALYQAKEQGRDRVQSVNVFLEN